MTKDEIIAECAATITWLNAEIDDEYAKENRPNYWTDNLEVVKDTVVNALSYIMEQVQSNHHHNARYNKR